MFLVSFLIAQVTLVPGDYENMLAMLNSMCKGEFDVKLDGAPDMESQGEEESKGKGKGRGGKAARGGGGGGGGRGGRGRGKK